MLTRRKCVFNETVSRDFLNQFFHETTPSGPLKIGLKRKRFFHLCEKRKLSKIAQVFAKFGQNFVSQKFLQKI